MEGIMKFKKLAVSTLIACTVFGSSLPVFVANQQVVVARAATKYSLNVSKTEMYVGNSFKLKLKGVKGKVKWTSEDDGIATVSKSGNVTANKKGKVIIKANYRGKNYRCVIKVKSANISEDSLTLREGHGFALTLNNTIGKAKWKSDNESVASVNDNGYISPLAIGTVKITAKLRNETYTCHLKVVKAFGEEDFVFDKPTAEGYTNYIDYEKNNEGWYFYYKNASDDGKDNRGVKIGSTKEEFLSAYGYCESYDDVSSYDSYREYFNNSAYPRTKTNLWWKDGTTQKVYNKTFYFDRIGTVVLIVTHR